MQTPQIGDAEHGVVAVLTSDQSINGGGAGEQDIWTAFTLPNSAADQGPIVGTTYRMSCGGIMTSTAGGGTLTPRIRFGGTVAFNATPLVLPNWVAGGTAAWYIDMIINIRTTGAGGTFSSSGMARFEWSAGSTLSSIVNAGAVNTTTGAILKVTGQWGTGAAGMIMTVQSGMVERLRA